MSRRRRSPTRRASSTPLPAPTPRAAAAATVSGEDAALRSAAAASSTRASEPIRCCSSLSWHGHGTMLCYVSAVDDFFLLFDVVIYVLSISRSTPFLLCVMVLLFLLADSV